MSASPTSSTRRNSSYEALDFTRRQSGIINEIESDSDEYDMLSMDDSDSIDLVFTLDDDFNSDEDTS